MELTRDLTIEDLAGGAVMEKLNYELQRVVENITDINMDVGKTREVVLKIQIKPNQEGTQAMVAIITDAKLAPLSLYPVHLFITKDKEGNAKALEVVMQAITWLYPVLRMPQPTMM